MKQIKFDMRFKEAILNKTMIATIRNSKKVALREVFEIVVDGEVIGKAECIDLLHTHFNSFLLNISANIKYGYENIEFSITNNLNLEIDHKQLGFSNLQEALDFYKTYLKNPPCYLHIFELVEG